MLDVGQGSSAAVALALAGRIPTAVPTAAWRGIGTLASLRQGAATSTDGTRIYFTHGGAGSNLTYSSGISIAADGTQTALPNAPQGRTYAPGAWCNGKHYAFGGTNQNDTTYMASVDVYTPAGTNGAAGTWTAAANMPNVRHHSSAATIGQFIYVAGGLQVNSATNTLYRFDTVAGTWSTQAPMLDSRFRGAMVAKDGKLFYLGGYNASNTAQSTVYIYDPAVNSWAVGAPLQNTVVDHTATVVGNNILIVNSNVVGQLNVVYLFDGAVTTILAQPPAIHQQFAGMATLGNNAYLIGGNSGSAIDTIDISVATDILNPGWTTKAALNGLLSSSSTSTDGTRIYVGPSYNNQTAAPTSSFYVIDPTTATGTLTANGPTVTVPRWGAAGAWCNGKHYVMGGLDQAVYANVDAYTPAGANGAAGSWTTIAGLPAARLFAAAAVVGQFIYVAGGRSGPGTLTGTNSLFRLDTVAGTWSTLTGMPAIRNKGAMVTVGTKLYYLCGDDTNANNTISTYIYDTVAGTWSAGLDAPSGPIAPAATAVGTNIYLFHSDVASTYVYNTVTNTWTTTQPDAQIHGQYASSVTIGTTMYLIGGVSNSSIDAKTIGGPTPLGRRVRSLQQFLLANGLPAASSAARRIPTALTAPTWTAVTPDLNSINRYRYGVAASSDGTNMIVTGGINSNTGDVLGGGYTLSPTGTYAAISSSAVTPFRYYCGGAFLGGKHYQIAGYNSSGTVVATSEAYTVATSTWTSIAAFPAPRMYVNAATLNGLLYATGGSGTTVSSGYTADFYVYNPSTNVWTPRASFLRALGNQAIAGVNGFIYSFGGVGTDGSNVTAIYRYDPSTNLWSTMSATLQVGGSVRVAVAGTYVVITTQTNSSTQIFNASNGTLTLASSMLGSRGDAPALASVNGIIMAAGGSNGITTTIERLDYAGLSTYLPTVSLTKSLVAAGV